MNLNITEIHDNLDLDLVDDSFEDVGVVDNSGQFTASTPSSKVPVPRVPVPRVPVTKASSTPVVQRKVTYDDILSSLNMKVVDGKLQIVRNTSVENIKSNNFNPNQNFNQKSQNINPNQNQNFNQNRTQNFNQNFNQNQNINQNLKPVLLTKEQYRQIQIANYMKAVQQQQQIKNMKSTKLMFSNTNINISPGLINKTTNNDLNKLFNLKGVGKR